MTNNNINQIFIKSCAHTVCGIKPANLFTVSASVYSEAILTEWKREMNAQGLSVKAVKRSSGTVMIFIYDCIWIRNILSDSLIKAYLKGKNYSCVSDTCKTLNELFTRLQSSEVFPHEVGVFLGYPVEDVISFEEKEGMFFEYCGYWKSYCNPEEARKCCDRYKQCSQMCKQWFEEGCSIPQIIKKYKKMALEAA